MTATYFNIYPTLTPVRLVSKTNIAGTYFNGSVNNGNGATLTIGGSSLTIDSVAANNNDRVALIAQTNGNENGIYTVSGIGFGTGVVLTRAPDMQNIEQLLAGQSFSIGAGSVSSGSEYSVVEPLPSHFGIDALNITTGAGGGGGGTAASKDASDNTQPTVSSVSGATVTNHVLVAADDAGTVKDSAGVVAIALNGLQTGQNGSQASLFVYPPGPNAGRIQVQAQNSTAGNFTCLLTNAPVNQNSTYILPSTNVATNTIMVDPSPPIGPGNIVVGGGSSGILQDAGYALVSNTANTPGGSATIVFPEPNITVDSVLTVTLNSATTSGAYILHATQEEAQFTVVFNADPGSSDISYIYTTVPSE